MGRRARAAVVMLASAGLLLTLYLSISLVLGGEVPLLRYSSGVFDMDVRRVVLDLTSNAPALRSSVHPLQKLFVAPLGGAVNRTFFGGRDWLAAAQVVVALATTLHVLGAGWLVFQLTRGAPIPAVLAGLLLAVSFSSLLAATVPESAALSSLGAVVPLLYLNTRLERPFSRAEAVGWGLVGVFCLAFTITQILNWGVALGVRVFLDRGALRADGRALVAKLAAVVAIGAVVSVGASALQSRIYPGTGPFYAQNPLLIELGYVRSETIEQGPARHLARLVGHFLLFDFVAPRPAYSSFLMRDYGLHYWSLSVEEAGLDRWSPAQRLVAAAHLLLLAAACTVARWRDRRLLALALCLAGQLTLHFFYGREYVLYSPNWHGVLVALLVAASWNGLSERSRRWAPLPVMLLAAALLANNVGVMRTVHREVEAGLGANIRDSEGRLLGAVDG